MDRFLVMEAMYNMEVSVSLSIMSMVIGKIKVWLYPGDKLIASWFGLILV